MTLEEAPNAQLTPEERRSAGEYANERTMSVSRLESESLLEKIEDACDLETYTAWLKEPRETVRFEDLVKECGFSVEEL
jgi:hypothetical protein